MNRMQPLMDACLHGRMHVCAVVPCLCVPCLPDVVAVKFLVICRTVYAGQPYI